MSNARDDRERLERDQGSGAHSPDSVLLPAEEVGLMHFATENFSTALEYFQQALQTPKLPDIPDRFRLLVRVCDSHRRKGDYSDSEVALNAAAKLVDNIAPDSTLGRLEARRSHIALARGSYDEAVRLAFSAYRRLKNSDDHVEVAGIQTLIGHCYLRMGMLSQAEEFFADALSSSRRSGDRVGVAYAHNNLGLLHKNACRWNRAISSLTRASDLAETLGLSQHIILVRLNLGVVYMKAGRIVDAMSVLSGAAKSAEQLGDTLNWVKALGTLGRAYMLAGEFAKAERTLVRVQAMATEREYAREATVIDEYIGELMACRGRFVEARANLESALGRARDFAPDSDVVAECLRRLADTELGLNHPARALEYIDEGLEIALKSEPYELGFLHRCRARCRSRVGDVVGAIKAIDSSLEYFEAHSCPRERAHALQMLSRYRVRMGGEANLTKAKQKLGESIVQFGKLEDATGQIVSHIMLAKVESRLGNVDEAMLAIYEADRLAEEEQNDKFRHALAALRDKIEGRMTRATTRVLDQFSVLGEIQSGACSREKLVSGLESTIHLIAERLGANGGFVAIPGPKGRSSQIVVRQGLSAQAARAINVWYSSWHDEEGERSVHVITDTSRREYDSLRDRLGPGDNTFLLHPLGFEGEELGMLCVRRDTASTSGPIAQDALHFVAAYASLISLSIHELVRVERRGRARAKRTKSSKGFDKIVTENRGMIQLLNLAERVAHSDATVLLQGETGTGKGLIAYAIHLLSDRRDHKFVHINCAALPEQLLESELFGHVRGAFTGAFENKSGLLEQADGGTIFLDEIGKTSMAMQGKLLTFLDTSRIRRVGSNDFKGVNVRVICASKANLLSRCEEGLFLEDFFYRINDFPLTIPPLRDRKEDVELLMNHYIEKFSREMHRSIDSTTDKFVERLRDYRWPGNVRELEKVVKRAVILADDGEPLDVSHLAPEIGRQAAPESTDDVAGELLTLRERIEKLEHQAIATALQQHDGNKSRAATDLGISYPNLLSKIKRYNIQ